MILKAEGDGFTEHLWDEIEALTDSAAISPGEVEYDAEARRVTVPMTRKELASPRRPLGKLLGKAFQHKRAGSEQRSVLIIGNVLECSFRHDDEAPVGEVTLLFGVRVREGSVYLCSAEEVAGSPVFEMDIVIGGLDIELRDIGCPG